MTGDVAITPAQRDILQRLLDRYLPDCVTWIYGSRVTGRATSRSDLDMVVFADGKQRQVSDLREALEESNLPFRVDLFIWDEIPESFRASIARHHVCFTQPEAAGFTFEIGHDDRR
jgi:predicted nucleotidyltransferase